MEDKGTDTKATQQETTRVLLADDSEHDRRFVRRLLEGANAGYEISECGDGPSALELLGKEKFSLLIADLNMPGMDGIELIRRAAPMLEKTGVMILTGSESLSPAIQALRLNVMDYVTKEPREQLRDTLLRRVENVVRHVRLIQQNEKLQEELRLRLAHLQQIHDQMPEAIFAAVEGNGVLTEINPQAAALLGEADLSVLIGRPVGEVFSALSPELGETVGELMSKGQSARNVYVEGEAQGGEARLFVLNLTRVESPAGGNKYGAGRWALSLRDVTPQRKRSPKGESSNFHGIIGNDPAIQKINNLIRRVAPLPTSVLIIGPTGTGKEVISRAIHEESNRANKPFIAVNCTALSGEILESELFGHVRGAFTGAVAPRKGRFREADGGTLFLDEIGDTRESFQTKLLRVLESGEIEPVGQDRPIKVDVRIICATNQDLPKSVKEGKFRSDLFYRINVVRIDAPALKDRPGDLPLLVEHFRREIGQRLKKNIPLISQDAMRVLAHHDWPGNVRELRHVLERAFVVAEGKAITRHDLPPYLASREAGTTVKQESSEQEPSEDHASLTLSAKPDEAEEIRRIQSALERSQGNLAEAAAFLSVHRSTLWRKIKQYRIEC